MSTYTVQKGDTLGAIARHQLGAASRWSEIARLNNLDNPDLIHPGQVLQLPSSVTGERGGFRERIADAIGSMFGRRP